MSQFLRALAAPLEAIESDSDLVSQVDEGHHCDREPHGAKVVHDKVVFEAEVFENRR